MLSVNPIHDISDMLSWPFMQHAFEAATAVAIVAGAVGYFVVLRRLAFAAHALAHIGFSGAAGAVAAGINPVLGLLGFSAVSAAGMGALGSRLRGRDTVIGIVLAFALGLGVLFLSFYSGSSTEAFSLLFGEILGISTTNVTITVVAAGLVLVGLVAVYRPLLFSSLDEDVAEARGVPVRLLSVAFMVLLALAVTVAAQVVGVLLIFALIVAPAAIAERVARTPAQAIGMATGLALAFSWLGLAAAYYSTPGPSFYITAFAFAAYLLTRAVEALRSAGR
jgi:zinc/manganese transport system permease protein